MTSLDGRVGALSSHDPRRRGGRAPLCCERAAFAAPWVAPTRARRFGVARRPEAGDAGAPGSQRACSRGSRFCRSHFSRRPQEDSSVAGEPATSDPEGSSAAAASVRAPRPPLRGILARAAGPRPPVLRRLVQFSSFSAISSLSADLGLDVHPAWRAMSAPVRDPASPAESRGVLELPGRVLEAQVNTSLRALSASSTSCVSSRLCTSTAFITEPPLSLTNFVLRGACGRPDASPRGPDGSGNAGSSNITRPGLTTATSPPVSPCRTIGSRPASG